MCFIHITCILNCIVIFIKTKINIYKRNYFKRFLNLMIRKKKKYPTNYNIIQEA